MGKALGVFGGSKLFSLKFLQNGGLTPMYQKRKNGI
uniref:Uncharacterized protein n=1 Tax=Rhizophora mucronata TaxID=61149 RepID=A0A2P2N4E2_RHIMU